MAFVVMIAHALWKTWLQLKMTWLSPRNASLQIGHRAISSPLAHAFASIALQGGSRMSWKGREGLGESRATCIFCLHKRNSKGGAIQEM